MKSIQPISIWYQGTIINANTFNLYVISDNLIDTAIFYYALYSGILSNVVPDAPIPTTDQLGTLLASGNITMSSTDYVTYESSPTSNDFAYSWGASQLNLTLI